MSDTPEEQAAHERLVRLRDLHEKSMSLFEQHLKLEAEMAEMRKDLEFRETILRAEGAIERHQAANDRLAAELQEMRSQLSPAEWDYLRRTRLGEET